MKNNLETIARVLGRCIIAYIIIASVWFAMYMAGAVCAIAGFFDINQHECSLLTYGGIGILKIIAMLLFVFPWVAIKLELKR